jgi:hypothetical protein
MEEQYVFAHSEGNIHERSNKSGNVMTPFQRITQKHPTSTLRASYISNIEISIVKAITFTKQRYVMDAIPGIPSLQWYTITNTHSIVWA